MVGSWQSRRDRVSFARIFLGGLAVAACLVLFAPASPAHAGEPEDGRVFRHLALVRELLGRRDVSSLDNEQLARRTRLLTYLDDYIEAGHFQVGNASAWRVP